MGYFLLLLSGIIAYFNSFRGVFVFDDDYHIVDNPVIRELWPLTSFLHTDRPVVQFSFALNYAASGLNPWTYHAVNLAIHLGAAILLMKILERTFSGREGMPARFLAFAAALLWLVHPLQTQSVTYVVQRAQSLMGFFYLLTFYTAIRYSEKSERRWAVLSVAACATGMATKAEMVTAPILIFFYDSVFLTGGWKDAIKKRGIFYLILAATCLIPVLLFLPFAKQATVTSGFAMQGITPWQYAITQSQVIIHYLRLIFWPDKLVLDYAWQPIAFRQGMFSALAVLILIANGFVLWRRNRPLGFLVLSFFILLIPTSSFYPLADLAAEHRLYLPLIVPCVLGVLGIDQLLKNKTALFVLILLIAATLTAFTMKRNEIYQSRSAVWNDILQKRPMNARAQYGLATVLFQKGDYDEAILHYEAALRIKPDYVKAINDLGLALFQKGQEREAELYYQKALEIMPDFPEAYNSLGLLYARQGKWTGAESSYEKALAISPQYAEAFNHLGMTLVQQGKKKEAVTAYEKALEIKPYYAGAHNNLGNLHVQNGKFAKAIFHYQQAIRLQPDFAEVYNNLGTAYAQEGQWREAVDAYQKSLKLKPDFAPAKKNLEMAEKNLLQS